MLRLKECKYLCKVGDIAVYRFVFRGGVGKSAITSAVARSQEIRKRFIDGIAWIGMSQAPDIVALQQRCFLQLTNRHVPNERRSSVEEQHKCLSEVLISKTCLIVLDDCCKCTL